jgi:hypothetical protein
LKASDEFVAGSPNHARASSHHPPGSDSESGLGGSGEDASAARAPSGLIHGLIRFVEEIVGSADGLVEVYADRMKQSVRRTIVQAGLGACAAVCAIVWLGAATLATLRGLCGGLAALWGGREWLGDLTGGALACALAGCAIALGLRLSSRRTFRRLKAKYERIQNESIQNNVSASPADHD